jgi:hypothetical protein
MDASTLFLVTPDLGLANLFMAQKPLVCQDLLIMEASQSHSDTPHLVELLWKGDQPDTETSTLKHTTLTTEGHLCRRRDSNKQ